MSRSRQTLSLLSALPLLVLANVGAAPAHRGGGVPICHHAGPTKTIDIEVAPEAVPAHVAQHGDTVGPCGPDT